MTARDDDRAAVYAAEDAAFSGTDLETPVPLDALIDRAGRVTTGGWWPGPPIAVRAARRDAMSSSARCGGSDVSIRIAAGQSTLATLAHELGHALAGGDRGHDELFRAAYLDAVDAVTNALPADRRRLLHVDQLAYAFAAAGLPVAERRWPRPTGGDPIAL